MLLSMVGWHTQKVGKLFTTGMGLSREGNVKLKNLSN